MISRIVTACFFILLPLALCAQLPTEKTALKYMKKQQWERAHKLLKKFIAKDSTDVTATFVIAQYFFDPKNSGFSIDSAYRYTVAASHNYQQATSRERERMKRFPLDSLILQHQRARIDSAAFERARSSDTEQSYVFFLQHFPGAAQHGEAIGLRNDAAYRDVLQQNTLQAYKGYLDKYPESRHATEARTRFDKLLFETHTRDKRLASYEQFIRDFPASPHRHEAEIKIFEISTASGSVAAFRDFLKKYPQSPMTRRARNILFHLTGAPEKNSPDAMSDSLRRARQLDDQHLIPFLHLGHFGFMATNGTVVIEPTLDDVAPSYRCGNVVEDVFIAGNKAVARNGAVVADVGVQSIEDLGEGFLLIEENNCLQVMHKSGFRISHCVDDAKLICSKFIALKKDNMWSLWTLTGKQLLNPLYTDIRAVGDAMIFQKDSGVQLATVEHVAAVADQQPLKTTDAFQELKPWTDSLLWLRGHDLEGVMDQQLNVHIDFDHGSLTQTFFGAVRNDNGVTLYNHRGKRMAMGDEVLYQKPWLLLRTGQRWHILDALSGNMTGKPFDSLALKGPFVVATSGDTVTLFFNQHTTLSFKGPTDVAFVPGQDSSAFAIVDHGNQHVLYDQTGKKLFSFSVEKIQHAGQHVFIVHKKEKKGLVGRDGKPLLPMEYDAIGSVRQNGISLLKGMKFGYYDVLRKTLIPPLYLKNVVPYTAQLLTAFKDGGWAFIGWNNKPLSAFEFSEIKYWNDSTALVRKNSMWMMYDIYAKKIIVDQIRDFRIVRDKPEERLFIVHQDNVYGVMSSVHGMVIPLAFSDLINVGSADEPVYFTEKHVEEASLFVVIYYSAKGEMLRKEVYEQDDYERIYCSQKN